MSRKRLIIALVSIAVLASVFAFLTFFGGEEAKVEEDFSSSINIIDLDYAINEYSVERPDGSFTFVKDMGTWKEKTFPDIVLEQDYITTSVTKASFLFAESLVKEDAQNLEEYGFDEPSAVVRLKGAQEESVIRFGAKTATGSGYYAVVDDSDDVYIVRSDNFEKVAGAFETFRVRELFTAQADNVEAFTLKSTKHNISIKRKTEKSPNESNISSWVMQTPYVKDLNTRLFEDNVLSKLAFTVEDFVDDGAKSRLADYGLLSPLYTISVKNTDGTTFTFHLGNELEDGKIYAQIDGGNSVYAISAESVKYRDFTPLYLLESLVFVRNVSAVEGIEFAVQGNTYAFSNSGENYFINGNKVAESDYKQAYRGMISPVVAGEVLGNSVGRELCSFTINYNTNTPSETVRYYEFGDMYAAASVNGKTEFYVQRKYVEDMINGVAGLIK